MVSAANLGGYVDHQAPDEDPEELAEAFAAFCVKFPERGEPRPRDLRPTHNRPEAGTTGSTLGVRRCTQQQLWQNQPSTARHFNRYSITGETTPVSVAVQSKSNGPGRTPENARHGCHPAVDESVGFPDRSRHEERC